VKHLFYLKKINLIKKNKLQQINFKIFFGKILKPPLIFRKLQPNGKNGAKGENSDQAYFSKLFLGGGNT
jgi:hypothetical protein